LSINKPLKLAFIGGGLNSAVGITHKIAAQMDGRWELIAGCFSHNEEINIQTADAWKIEKKRLYANYQMLLEQEKGKIDAIVVLTPTPSHSEIVISSLSHGYPVICEKALAVSSQEAKQIKRAVQKNNAYLAVTYNYTGYPMLRELQNVIAKGNLGKINQVHIEMPQEGFLRIGKTGSKPTPQQWRLQDYTVPTLSLDLGVHLHHMVNFLTQQKPVELVAVNNNFGLFEGIIDNTMCIARYTNNLDCQFWYSKTALGHTNGLRVRVYGSNGSAEWYQMQPEYLTLYNNQGQKSILERSYVELNLADETRYNRFKAGHPAGFIEAFANHYYDLADTLIEFKQGNENSSPWIFGVDTALEGLQMFEAMVRSAQTKSWQSLLNE